MQALTCLLTVELTLMQMTEVKEPETLTAEGLAVQEVTELLLVTAAVKVTWLVHGGTLPWHGATCPQADCHGAPCWRTPCASSCIA